MGIVTLVSFDGFDLQNDTYKTIELDPMGSPDKSITMLPLAREDGSILVHENYNAKTITLTGSIKSDSKESLELAIDALKKHLRRRSGNLQYDWGGGVRIHKCVATKFGVDKSQGYISYTPIAISFQSESPFATDGITDTIIASQIITTASKSFTFNVNGTMDSAPVITLQINAINPDNVLREIVLSNASLSKFLTIESIFEAGDIVVIDCVNYTIFKNGEYLFGKGQFPQYDVGSGSLQYSDNATTRNITINATMERKFL